MAVQICFLPTISARHRHHIDPIDKKKSDKILWLSPTTVLFLNIDSIGRRKRRRSTWYLQLGTWYSALFKWILDIYHNTWKPRSINFKLASYASPPLSPKPWADLDLHRPQWDSLMDGDNRKQNERLMGRSGHSTARGRTTDPFESSMHPRGDPTGLSQAPDRATMSYDYGYTGSSFTGGSLQGNEMQSYTPEFIRPRQPPSAAGGGGGGEGVATAAAINNARRRAQDIPPFVPYESAMLYEFGQQGPGSAPGPFEVVPQYPPRQSAAMAALSNEFAVSQYFAHEEPSGTPAGLSPYLNALPYNQPGPMARPNTMQPFPATMSDFTPIGPTSGRLEHPSQQPEDSPRQSLVDPSSLDEAYARYRRALRSTFDHTRAGRLVEASRSLLEISGWLVANARDLGRFGPFFIIIFLLCLFYVLLFLIFWLLFSFFFAIHWPCGRSNAGTRLLPRPRLCGGCRTKSHFVLDPVFLFDRDRLCTLLCFIVLFFMFLLTV